MTVTLHHGDCLDVMRTLPDASVDSVVTDPPYGLGFMGRAWDALPPGREWAEECLRVLKPGGHLLAFGGTRTWHRLAVAVEDVGFEVRDSIAWLYGSGFPKSLDVSKAIDKAAGREAAPISESVFAAGAVASWLREECGNREVGSREINAHFGAANIAMRWLMTEPTATKRPQVPRWDQWEELRRWLDLPDDMDAEVWRLNGMKGTPAPLAFTREAKVYEQSHGFARVSLAHGAQKSHTATAQVERLGYATGPGDAPATDDARTWQGWGTALKPAFEPIAVARKPLVGTVAANVLAHGTGALNVDGCRIEGVGGSDREGEASQEQRYTDRGATNFAALPGPRGGSPAGRWPANVVLDESQAAALDEQSGDLQGATSYSNGTTRNVYSDHIRSTDLQPGYGDNGGASRFFYTAKADSGERVKVNGVAHPTVKPLSLMRWLVRLVTPPGGTVLEPFAGSGTTVEACVLEGFQCIAIEREAEYLPLIQQRINRRRDPVAAIKATEDDGGLFDLLDDGAA